MTTRIDARFVDLRGMRLEVQTPAGHRLELDTSHEDWVAGAASPKEALLAALAGCTAMDVASILRKKRQVPDAYELVVTGESASEHPRVFTSVVVEHRVSGGVEAEAVRRSIELSATRYCPVSAMLSAAVRIAHRYRLRRPDGSEAEALVVVTGPPEPAG